MKKGLWNALTAALLSGVLLSAAGCTPTAKPYEAPDATLTIHGQADTANARNEISDTLFGVFLEDINYASYAMDDNLVANGLFEFDSDHWLVADGASLVRNETGGVSGACAAVEIPQSGGAVLNTGYSPVPMAVEKGIVYHFSAFIRASGYDGKVRISVRNEKKTVAEAQITVAESDEWVKYAADLTATESVSSGLSLCLTFESAGKLQLDGVALETGDSTAGIKNYMYEPIKELSPRFVRFPGGCVIEGKNMDSAYDWKNSIGVGSDGKAAVLTYTSVAADGTSETVTTTGEAVTRTPNTDIWQTGNNYYRMEYGIGFYDYFLLCESIGASAIPILNCGISCMIQSNGADLPGRNGNGAQDYIQDALDLVAFAIGDPDSEDENEAYWASVRAAMGHEEPFEMQYLGIGNEQWGRYFDRYEMFLEAFASAAKENPIYGKVQLIVGNGAVFTDTETDGRGGLARAEALAYQSAGKINKVSEYGVHDHHYYMNYTDFLTNVHHYDSYSRDENSRYDVFVGEYSANQINNLRGTMFQTPNNSWIAALSEAAYMTGLERNGDVVKLAAYAPMFGNAESSLNQWAVDMMYYNNTELVRSANYYVQQLFMLNQGKYLLDSELTYSDGVGSTYKIVGASNITVDKLFTVVSKEAGTGDIIVKIVNASPEDIALNITLSDVSAAGKVTITELQNDNPEAVNSLGATAVSPVGSGANIGGTFGYLSMCYSAAVIRIPVA